MNTPNKLTVARIIATPIFMITMIWDFPFHYLAAFLLFIGASLTDLIDGKMARKHNLVTNFGKFLDPLADKMLTTAAYLGFIYVFRGTVYCWQIILVTFIVLFREFAISSVRLVVVSSDSGKVIAANIWGKTKTVSQMLSIIAALFAYVLICDIGINNALFVQICNVAIAILFWISAAVCVISGAVYMIEAKDYINPSK